MEKMKAVILEEIGGIENFRVVEVNKPIPQKGEVRIKIYAAAFNPVDIKTRNGQYGRLPPTILGSDCSGVIDEVGPDVSSLKPGDEVIAMPFGWCSNGSYAQYVVTPYQLVAKKPKHLSFEESACIPLAGLTAYRAVKSIPDSSKKPMLIAGGAGGVGSIAIQLLQVFYGNSIYVLTSSKKATSFIKQKLNIGRENIIQLSKPSIDSVKRKLKASFGKQSFFATFDFVGQEWKKLCVELTDYSGFIVSTVPEPRGFSDSPWSQEEIYFRKNLTLHTVFVGAESFSQNNKSLGRYEQELEEIISLFNTEKICIPSYQTIGKLDVNTVKAAHKIIENKKASGKLVMSIV